MPLLKTRATIYLGSWNARTMWGSGRAFQIAAEVRRYKLEVLGISETHWMKVGQQQLTSGELLLYSVDGGQVTDALQVFINNCLHKILNVCLSDTFSNNLLFERTNQVPAEEEIGKRRCNVDMTR
ncbi:unnamed protein product [Schistosoma margrebowiei]|uniref:Uncharacterized protein n=1 Tax=Schistosoma margrebowiei TaxID=48269 RepID=A0A183M250_9TREM|nr:unnamed protein product [Schistosoma margrebowiei]